MIDFVGIQDLVVDGLSSSALQVGQGSNLNVCDLVANSNIHPNTRVAEQMHPQHVQVVFFYVQTYIFLTAINKRL